MRGDINLELPEELTLFTVEEYRTKVVKKISDKEIISLDASKLCSFDGAGVQLLLSLHKSFPQLRIKNLSEELSSILDLMGVRAILTNDRSVNNG